MRNIDAFLESAKLFEHATISISDKYIDCSFDVNLEYCGDGVDLIIGDNKQEVIIRNIHSFDVREIGDDYEFVNEDEGVFITIGLY